MTLSAFRNVLDDLADALIGISRDGRIIYWGPSTVAMLGLTAEEALGRLLVELVLPAGSAEDERLLLAQAMEKGIAIYESVRRKKDGTLIHVDVTSKRLHDAEHGDFILSSEKDVTRLKVLRDTKLLRSRFGDLIESVPDAIVMANATGRIVLANGQAERLFGYEDDALLGQPVETLLPQHLHDAHVAHRAGYFSQPHTRSMGVGLDLRGRRSDGSEFPVEISLSPLHTEEGTLVMSAIRDITERKRFETALQEKNIELAAANAAKDRFLATMSHELRTPLTAIIGFTGTLLMKLPGPLNPDQEKQLATVRASANHLLSLINDLLDLAKIEAGKVELAREWTPCRDVLQEVASALEPQAAAKGLAFRWSAPHGEMAVRTDRRALHQILLNLATNAIKFTDSGSVELVMRRAAADSGHWVELSVTDTGIGIPAADQERLFEAFARVNSTREREGTGLGLHLSGKLAGLLGGCILFRSKEGAGSTFTLRLPETGA